MSIPIELSGIAASEFETVAKPSEKIRLDYLDGIRGLCALYVVFCHGDIAFNGVAGVPNRILSLLPLLSFGHYMVAFFIVLSGYCLMLPVARSSEGLLRGGTWDYLKRRAHRILPPYYAALALALLIDSLPLFRKKIGMFAEVMFPAFDLKIILAHLLLVHNLNQEYGFRIDPPMWSVAPEWQIYFLFPLLLLPIWRRFGIAITVLCAFFLGYIPHFFLPSSANLDWTCPWYLRLFTIGMAAAAINFSTVPRLKQIQASTPFLLVPLVILPAIAYAVLAKHDWQEHYTWITDTLVGFAAGAIIAYCTRELLAGRRPFLARLLESRPVQWLGLISYSLYLVHFPIISALNECLHQFHPTGRVAFSIVAFVFIPICILSAYIFHLIFERPFMPSHGRDVRATGNTGVGSPAA